jgi:hypothetical protein
MRILKKNDFYINVKLQFFLEVKLRRRMGRSILVSKQSTAAQKLGAGVSVSCALSHTTSNFNFEAVVNTQVLFSRPASSSPTPRTFPGLRTAVQPLPPSLTRQPVGDLQAPHGVGSPITT